MFRKISLMAGSTILAALLLRRMHLWGGGTPIPLRDMDGRPLLGSISEKIGVEINGVRQGMFILSKDATHPVLLYLHGGLPEYFLTERYPTGFENDFTVVWWEQRGAGLSYSPHIPPETMTSRRSLPKWRTGNSPRMRSRSPAWLWNLPAASEGGSIARMRMAWMSLLV